MAGQRPWGPPADHVVAQVPLEHEAPAFDGVEEGLLEGPAVTLQPAVEHLGVLALGHLLIQLLIGVDLEDTTPFTCRAAGARGWGQHSTCVWGRPLRGTSFLLPAPPGCPAAQQSIPDTGQPVKKGHHQAGPAGAKSFKG